MTILEAHDLRKRFGSVEVLKGLNLTLQPGLVYGFLGRNGAGKTTTLRAVMGLQPPDSGTLRLFGQTVTTPGPAIKQRIGYVSQEQHLYPWMTCRRIGRFVAGFFPDWDAAEYARLLDSFHLPPKRKVGALSGGMKAKLALALALAHRPDLLLLDEPTAGLDPAARREFVDVVRRQADEAGRTTLFSSHIVEEVERVADVVGILVDGQLAYEGPIPELLDSLVCVSRPVDSPAPEGFVELAREREAELERIVLRGDPAHVAAWMEADPPSERVSLEDAFLALAVGRA